MNDDVRRAVERVFREEYGLVVSVLMRRLRDLDLAEDVVSEALAAALAAWPERGIPDRPAAWLTTTARRRAIDRLRRMQNLERKTEDLAVLTRLETGPEDDVGSAIVDDRLRLVFTCCHPALSREASVALTLKTLGGLTTGEIARAFLVTESTMYQRIVRAKRKIREAAIPYEVPPDESLHERLASVLAVVYLIFNEGYLATHGDGLTRPDLASEAVRLGRVLADLMPDEPEVLGLLACMLLHESRRPARVGPLGELVPMEDQDRTSWDAAMAAEGTALVQRALRMGRPGGYQIQAAIAAVHGEAASAATTDWMQIAALYGELMRHQPGPVVALNHAVAVGMWRGPDAGLGLMDGLAEELSGYHLYHSARADLLRKLGRRQAAAGSYRAALGLVTNAIERRYLERRLAEVGSRDSRPRPADPLHPVAGDFPKAGGPGDERSR